MNIAEQGQGQGHDNDNDGWCESQLHYKGLVLPLSYCHDMRKTCFGMWVYLPLSRRQTFGGHNEWGR